MDESKLNGIIERHKDWILKEEAGTAFLAETHEAHQANRADLSGTDLSGVELRGVNLKGANLQNINLSNADLSGANFEEANLQGANLSGAILKKANFTKAELESVDLSRADLTLSKLIDANLLEANLSFSDLRKADLRRAMLDEVTAESANFRMSSAKEIIADDANFNKADFSRSKLVGASFDTTNLTDACLSRADLTDAIFTRSNLSSASFERAKVSNTNFSAAKNWKKSRLFLFFSLPKSISLFSDTDPSQIKNNPLLVQYAADQAYLVEYREQRPILYWLWLALCDCGRSIWLLGFWSLVVATLFALLFAGIGVEQFTFSNFSTESPPPITLFYYSIVTFTTLGFGDVTPLTTTAMMAVMAEVIVGYIFLGMLISVLATRVARRS